MSVGVKLRGGRLVQPVSIKRVARNVTVRSFEVFILDIGL